MGEICLSTGWFALLFWATASIGAIGGFFLCAILTMAKRADEQIEKMPR